jgi:hypothetical protein
MEESQNKKALLRAIEFIKNNINLTRDVESYRIHEILSLLEYKNSKLHAELKKELRESGYII